MCSRPPWAFRPGAAANARRIRPAFVCGPIHFCRLRQKNRSCACDQALPPGKSSAYIITWLTRVNRSATIYGAAVWRRGLRSRASRVTLLLDSPLCRRRTRKLAPRAFLSALIQKCGNYDTVAPVVAGARWMEGGCRRRDANLTVSNSTRPFITARQPNLDVRLT